jgi:hypothetical protein
VQVSGPRGVVGPRRIVGATSRECWDGHGG